MFHLLRRLRAIGFILLVPLFLCGCLDYDASIQFKGSSQGQLVQHIRLDRQFTNLNPGRTADWLDSIESRTQQLGGKVERPSSRELVATIPFYSGNDLETRFNQFFQGAAAAGLPAAAKESSDAPQVFLSQLKLTQDNYLVVRRNHLVYDLDLTGLTHMPGDLIEAGQGMALALNLETPWGIYWGDSSSPAPTPPEASGDQTWKLSPDQVNHVDVMFWLPSPLGIGAVVIAGVTGLGLKLKAAASD